MTAPTLTPARTDRPACADNPDRQYPDLNDPAGIEAAKWVCHRCPIRRRCLTDAIRWDERLGVWGGFTTPERDRLTGATTGGARMPVWRCTSCRLPWVPTQAAAKDRKRQCPPCVARRRLARAQTLASGRTPA